MKEVLGGGRLTRSLRCVADVGGTSGDVVVKVYFRREGDARDAVDRAAKALERGPWGPAAPAPAPLPSSSPSAAASASVGLGVMGWGRVVQTERAVYAVRQWCEWNLAERCRAGMGPSEKRWVGWQMCRAVAGLHASGGRHGDLTCENVVGTSWGWVCLVDACAGAGKPTWLAADNPSGFRYWFDAGGRRRCYVAPERFIEEREGEPVAAAGGDGGAFGGVTEAMDVFSLGCMLAELWLDGEALFDLGTLLAYRADPEGRGGVAWRAKVARIGCAGVRARVARMTAAEAGARGSAADAAEDAACWPAAGFERHLAPLGAEVVAPGPGGDPDLRVVVLQHRCSLVLREVQEAGEGGFEGLEDVCEALAAMGCGFLRRGCRVPHVRRAALRLLAQGLAPRIGPRARVWTILPHACACLVDARASVRASAVDAVADVLLATAERQGSGDDAAAMVVEVVLPALRRAAGDAAGVVQVAVARRAADVAEASIQLVAGWSRGRDWEALVRRLVAEMAAAAGAAGARAAGARQQVLEGPLARRLCAALGAGACESALGPTWLAWVREDPEWRVRAAFLGGGCPALVRVCSRAWSDAIVWPAVEGSLVDPEDHIAAAALGAVAEAAEEALLGEEVALCLGAQAAPLLVHPSPWLRRRACGALAAVAGSLAPTDVDGVLWPAVAPFVAPGRGLRAAAAGTRLLADAALLHAALRAPLQRSALDRSVSATMLRVQERVDAHRGALGLEEALARVRIEQDDGVAGFLGLLGGGGGGGEAEAEGAEAEAEAEARFGPAVVAYVQQMALSTRVRMMEWESSNEARLRAEGAGSASVGIKGSALLDRHAMRRRDTAQGTRVEAEAPVHGAARGVLERLDEGYFDAGGVVAREAWRGSEGRAEVAKLAAVVDAVGHPPARRGRRAEEEEEDEDDEDDEEEEEEGTQAGFRPRGVLVAHLGEHQGGVRCVWGGGEGRWALSCSDDGMTKVWDVCAAEGAATHGFRSAATYAGQGGQGPLVSGCCVGGSMATGSRGGTVHVWRVDAGRAGDGTAQMRTFAWDGDAVTQVAGVGEHVVAAARVSGVVGGWDVRARGDRAAWTVAGLQRSRGHPTCFTVDPRVPAAWMCVGTSRGWMEVVDLRGGRGGSGVLSLKRWRHPSGAFLRSMATAPGRLAAAFQAAHPAASAAASGLSGRARAPLVAVAAGEDECGVWDLEFGRLVGAVKVQSSLGEIGDDTDGDNVLAHVPPPLVVDALDMPRSGWDDDADDVGLADFKWAAGIRSDEDVDVEYPLGHVVRGRVECVLADRAGDVLVTGGSDRCVRLWDVRRPAKSYIVCGEPRPTRFETLSAAEDLDRRLRQAGPKGPVTDASQGGPARAEGPVRAGSVPPHRATYHASVVAPRQGARGVPVVWEDLWVRRSRAAVVGGPGLAAAHGHLGEGIATMCVLTPPDHDAAAALAAHQGHGHVPPFLAEQWDSGVGAGGSPRRFLVTGGHDGAVKVWK